MADNNVTPKWTHRGVEITLTQGGLFSFKDPSTNTIVVRSSLIEARNLIDRSSMVNKNIPVVCWDDAQDLPQVAMLKSPMDIRDPMGDDSFLTPYLSEVGDLEKVSDIRAEYEAFFAKMEERRQEFLQDRLRITEEFFFFEESQP